MAVVSTGQDNSLIQTRAQARPRAGTSERHRILGFLPRILVLADDDHLAGPLCQGLDELGWTTVTARSVDGAVSALSDIMLDGVIVDVRGLSKPDDVRSRTDILRQTALPRITPILGIGADGRMGQVEGVDLMMSGPPHGAQIALRMEQLIRSAVAEEELEQRHATLAAHGADLVIEEADTRPVQILAAGAPDRRFLALANAIEKAGGEVVAAPTPYTAFDYLHERAFDAAVLWGADDHAPALSIAAGMKRNTRLYHIPLSLYLRGAAEIELSALYQRGFADVAAVDTLEQETADRIMALAHSHRRRRAVRQALDAHRALDVMDAATGLFTPELFAHHLARLADSARLRRRALSVCVLRVSETPKLIEARVGGWLDKATPQIGAMIARLVRVEDTAARLAPEIFALALPATDREAAEATAKRIAAVIACTAFDAGPEKSPFVVEFDFGAAELTADEKPSTLLERASFSLSENRRRSA